MINTFWNLCRACPIPAESKLHAEYKRSFAWQPGHPEPAGNVVVKPPDATSLEPALARKKKHPEVAYRTSDILGTDGSNNQAAVAGLADTLDRDSNDHCYRARPGERSNKSKVGSRSRSADPSLGRGRPVMSHGDEAPCKTSEYRAAFAWPPKPSLPPAPRDVVDGPHRAEPTDRLLPRDDSHETKKTTKRTEYKAKFKPFSSYMYIDGSWKKPKAIMSEAPPVVDPNQWYTEVVERLHMADEYRIRSRAGALQTAGPTASHRTTTLWAKLDSSASLAALALAHTPRLTSAKAPPRERPTPASIHRSQSAKRREKTDAEAGRTTDTSEKKSPTKAVSPVKAEGNQRKASPAAKSAATARQKQTSPKTPAKHDEDAAKTTASSRTRAASSPPQRRTPLAEADKKDDKKTGASRPRRPLQESAAPPAAKPRAVVRPASAAVNEQDGKIWLKPQGKPEGEEAAVKEQDGIAKAEDAGGGEDGVLVPPATTPAESVEAATPGSGSERKSDAVRPSSLPPMNGSSASSSALASADMASPSPLPEPQSGPVPLTTVKSPEEVTGVKSPDPETWTVPLDTGRGLEWTDGQSPAGDWPGKAKTAPIIDTAPKPTPAPKTESTIPEGKVDPIPKAVPEDSPHKGTPEDPVKPQPAGQTGVDVLDKARNRLEEFWVTGK